CGCTCHNSIYFPAKVYGFRTDKWCNKRIINWTFEGTVLTAGDVSSDGRIATRAKVIYNDSTGKYVMYFKFKNADGSNRTYGIATCNTVDGHYVFQGRDYPSAGDFGDRTLFKDDDNKAYLVYSYLNASRVFCVVTY
ncbi:MAG: hypothetical protein MJA31_18300, partial [Clostridia bacterium]|nr:hypothetical protein [Clostridia bacterium]